jgi:hypothetical protein
MAAEIKIRIGQAALSRSPSPSQTPRHSGQIVFTGSRASNESVFSYRPTTKFRTRPRTRFMATLPFRNAGLPREPRGVPPALLSFCSRLYSTLLTCDPLLASAGNGHDRRTTVGFLIHGSAIKTNSNPQLFNYLRNPNRRLKGVYRWLDMVNDGGRFSLALFSNSKVQFENSPSRVLRVLAELFNAVIYFSGVANVSLA